MPALTIVENLQNIQIMCKKSKLDSNNNKIENGFNKEKKTNMEKEIFEQSKSLQRVLDNRVDFKTKRVHFEEIERFVNDILRCKRLIIIGVGSSYNLAISIRQIFEELVELPVFVELASDFLDREVPVFRDDVCIFISQSGETGTMIEACEYCKNHEALIMAVTNDTSSLLNKMSDFTLDIHANKELGIASTKTYCNQFATMVLLALYLSADKKNKLERRIEIIDEFKNIPEKIESVLSNNDIFKDIGEHLDGKKSVLVMGRGYQRGTCLEGSLKLKEVTNIHSEGIHSGELKHGPLALIDDEIPIIMIVMRDAIYDKCINALEQVRARNGNPIVICEKGDTNLKSMAERCIEIPKTIDCLSGILTVIPFQLISLYFALQLGKSVDQSESLVKTVIERI